MTCSERTCRTLPLAFCLVLLTAPLFADFQRDVQPLLHKHCLDCHGAKKQEGDVRFDRFTGNLTAHPGEAELWAKVLEQLEAGTMPPEKRPRPTNAEVTAATTWIKQNVREAQKMLARKMRFPENGNLVPHEKLFDPETAKRAPKIAASPARIWRVMPETYLARQHGFHDRFGGFPGEGRLNPAPFGLYVKNELKNYSSLFTVEAAESEGLANNALAMVQRAISTEKHYKDPLIRKLAIGEVEATDQNLHTVLTTCYELWLRRKPTAEELASDTAYLRDEMQKLGRKDGLLAGLVTIMVDPEAVFALELGDVAARREPSGEATSNAAAPGGSRRIATTGPQLLAPNEIADALERAIVDKQDRRITLGQFHPLAAQGKLATRDDVRAALAKVKLNTSQTMFRFVREFFIYKHSELVFKCPKDIQHQSIKLKNPYFEGWQSGKDEAMPNLTQGTEELVREVLEDDRHVLRELLLRPVSYPGRPYRTWRQQLERSIDNHHGNLARMRKERDAALAANDAAKVATIEKQLAERENSGEFRNLEKRLAWLDQPDLPNRIGVLNMRAWLVANSTNVENHAIHRGKWIRERLLGQRLPELPIGVDAALPEAPEKTLRERMEKTRQADCWRCHQLMDPLGFPFERYDHFGSFRETELGRPVDTSGEIVSSGDPAIDGPVSGPEELVRKLASSERVAQSFVRHAFRFWMGRNETLDDARTIQEAYQAYRESEGSMSALVSSLLTSDAFLYRYGAK